MLRSANRKLPILLLLACLSGVITGYFLFNKSWLQQWRPVGKQPNFLFIITDDQSWLHTSFAGYPAINTPNFDRIANEGVYFEHAYASAPTCTASRSAILAGQHFWRLGSAAQLWGEFPPSLMNYQTILAEHGYKTGYTGKGWGPGKATQGNPAGPDYNAARLANPDPNLSPFDFAENFRQFLAQRKPGQPFSYWLSPLEPHRPYHLNLGRDSGTIPMDLVVLPPYLPNDEVVRNDVADYLYEIQWFDQQLGQVLKLLAEQGELENTVVVFTSDNGMPFPRSKSNNYEYGTHVPLAVRWGAAVKQHQEVSDFISLTDIAPTLLDLAGIAVPEEMTGRSFRQQLLASRSGQVDPNRLQAYSGFERHTIGARLEGHGYPSRAIHTADFLYIRNLAPDRWPAGRPPGFDDIDEGSPTKIFLISKRKQFEQQWHDTLEEDGMPAESADGYAKNPSHNPAYALVLAAAKRPAEELYAIRRDPGQLHNLANEPAYLSIKEKLAHQLEEEMKQTKDPWAFGKGAVFDSYPYYAQDQSGG